MADATAPRRPASKRAPPVTAQALERASGPQGRALATALLAWYDDNRRVLPWREQPGPYRTWLSEVMLQQTRVDTVLPRYERFLARFPTVQALASADLDEVLGEWSGLGYYSRARNLHAAAQAVVAMGGFPQDRAGLRRLPGVGEYVSGAIASIALGLDCEAVDGNVERVLSRLYRHEGGRVGVAKLARAMLPTGRAGDFNQALMDLGSRICTPRGPSCETCPLASGCLGLASGRPEDWPPAKVRRVVPERAAVGLVLVRRGRVLLARRPARGLFGGLYELPGDFLAEGEGHEQAVARVARERLGLTEGRAGPALGELRHTLTHMHLNLVLHPLMLDGDPASSPPSVDLRWYTASTWVPPQEPGELGLSTLARKALALVVAPDPQLSLL